MDWGHVNVLNFFCFSFGFLVIGLYNINVTSLERLWKNNSILVVTTALMR